jgi:hypothetical protein
VRGGLLNCPLDLAFLREVLNPAIIWGDIASPEDSSAVLNMTKLRPATAKD